MTMKKNILVISTSLNPQSISRIVSKQIADDLTSSPYNVRFIDLQEYTLPPCNGAGNNAYEDPSVKTLHDIIAGASAVILAAPIYNFNVGSTVKNLIELTGTPHPALGDGSAWRNKPAGFIFGAGSLASHLAGLPLINSMLVDFKCIVHPHYIVAPGSAVQKGVISPDLRTRMDEFTQTYLTLANALISSHDG